MACLFPEAFERALPGTGSGEPRDSSTRQTQQAKASPTKNSTERAPDDQSGAIDGEGPSPSAKKLKGYRRPEVSNLLFCKRLDKPSSDYSKDRRKKDNVLLSAALAVVSRGEQAGASSEEISRAITHSKCSKESYCRLWPSAKYRRQYALKHAGKYGTSAPEIRCVDDKYIIHTSILAGEGCMGTDDYKKDQEVYQKRPLPIEFVPHHDDSSMLATDLTGELIQHFINRDVGNYLPLAPYIHMVGSRLMIYWVNLKLSGLRWRDTEDSDFEIAIAGSPLPRKKKRKLSEGEAG
jgi:hypothetical protein